MEATTVLVKAGLQQVSRGEHETEEQGVGFQRSAGELGVELRSYIEAVRGDLGDLHALSAIVVAGEVNPLRLQRGHVLWIHLVAMAVAFVHDRLVTVELEGEGVGVLDDGDSVPESHGAAHLQPVLLGHEHDHRVRCGGVELGRVGVGKVELRARVRDHRRLEPQTDSKVRNVGLAAVGACQYLALDASVSESAGNKNAVDGLHVGPRLGEGLGGLLLGGRLERRCVDPDDLELHRGLQGGVLETLDDAQVRIRQAVVLAHDSDLDVGGRR